MRHIRRLITLPAVVSLLFGGKGAAQDLASFEKKVAAKTAGQALFAKAAAAFGRPERLAAVKDLTTTGKVTVKTPQGEMELGLSTQLVFPDRLRSEIRSPMGVMIQVLGPGGAFMETPMGPKDLPGPARDEMLMQLQRQPVFLARKANDPKLEVSAAGKERIGTVEAEILDLAYDRIDVRWFVDPASGGLLRTSHSGTGPDGPVTAVTDYSDYRPFEGLSLPFLHEVSQNGQKTQTLRVQEIEVNAGADPKAFEKLAPRPAS
jgi:hypothetical protein